MIRTDRLIKRMAIPLLAMAAFALLTNQAMATPATWNGSADSQWSNPNNWDGLPASVPGSGEQATFDGAGNGNTALDLGGGVTNRYIRFNSAACAAYTIGSGDVGSQTLTFNPAVPILTMENTVTNDQLVNANIVLGIANGNQNFIMRPYPASQTLTLAGDISSATTGTKLLRFIDGGSSACSDTLISGAITDGAGVVRIDRFGTCIFTLSNTNNSHSGGTYIWSGDLVCGGSGVLGTGLLGIGNTTVDLSGFDQSVGGIFFGSVGAGLTQNLTTGANTLTLTGNLTPDNNARGTKIISGHLDLGGATRTFRGNGWPATVSADIAGTGAGIEIQSGTIILSGDNTYDGVTTLDSGLLALGVDSQGAPGAITASPISTNALVFDGGGVSSYSSSPREILNDVTFTATTGIFGDTTRNGYLTFSGPVDLGGSDRTITVNSDAQIDGVVSSGGLWKDGDGTLILNNTNNTFSGIVGSNRGILRWGAAGVVPDTAGIGVAAGTLDFAGYDVTAGRIFFRAVASTADIQMLDTGSATLTLNGNISQDSLARGIKTIAGNLELSAGDHTFNGHGSSLTTVAADISGAGASITIGSGRWAFSHANTYDAGTTINGGGVLFLENTGALPPVGTITAKNANGTLALTLGGAGYFSGSDIVAALTNNLAGATMEPNSSIGADTTLGDYTIADDMTSSTRGMAKYGPNTLTLSGDLDLDKTINPYALRVYEGTLLLTGNNTNATGTVRVESGAALAVTTTNSAPYGAFSFADDSTFKLLNDSSTHYTVPSLLSVSSMTIFVDQAPGGSGSNQTHRITELRTGGSRTVVVDGDHGYALTVDTYRPSDGNNNYIRAKTDLNITQYYASKMLPLTVDAGATINIGEALPYGSNGGIRMDGGGTINFNGPAQPNPNQSWQVNGPKVNVHGTMTSNGTARLDVSAGSIGGTGTIDVAVNLNNNSGSIDLRDGAVDTLTLGSTLAIKGGINANNLTFDLGNGAAGTDKITVAGAVTVTTPGAAVIHFNQLAGAPINNGTNVLIEGATSIDPVTDFKLALTDIDGKHFELQVTSNNLEVVITGSTPGLAALLWDGDVNDSWILASNWVGNASVPGWDSNVEFYQTNAANRITDLDQDFQINSLSFTTNAIAEVDIEDGVQGSRLYIAAGTENGNAAGNGITVATPKSGSPRQDLRCEVYLLNRQTWTVESGAHLAVLSSEGFIREVSSGSSLTKAGTGQLTFFNNDRHTFTGGMIVDEGTLTMAGNAGAAGILDGSAPLTINPAGTVQVSGSYSLGRWDGAVTELVINGGVFSNSVNNYAYAAYTNITMEAGIITDRGGNAYFDFSRRLGNPTFNVLANTSSSIISAKFDDPGPHNNSWDATLYTFAVEDGPAAVDLLFSGVMAHAAPVAKSGAGLMVLSGANTFSGSTTISDGTLQIGNGGGSGSLAPVSSILNKGTLAFSRTNTVTQGADFGPISGSGGVSQLGSGTVHLVGVNGYTGGTRVESGILSIDTAFLADSADVHLSSGTELNLAFGGTDTIQDLYFNGVPQAVGTWGANGSAAVNQSDFFSGSGILNVAGSVPVAPTASFSADPTSGEAPVTVTFTDTSSGTITNRFWDFGDGVTSSTTSTLVMHTYTNAGTFSVELLVSGSLGSSTNTQTDLIDVNQAAPPPPEYAGDVFTLSNGEATIHFTTVAGYQYGAIYKDAMTNATWQPLIFDPDYPLPEGWSAIATNGTAMITDTNAVSHPRRFYRLRSQNPTP